MEIKLSDILAGGDPARPYVLLPPGATGHIVYDPPEGTAIVVSGRYLQHIIQERNPGVEVITRQRFALDVAAGKRWDLVVAVGATTIPGLGTQASKAFRRCKAPVVLVASYVPAPIKLYGIAYALRKERETFGSYREFVNNHFFVLDRGWGKQWIKGVRGDAIPALAAQMNRIIDRRFAPAPSLPEPENRSTESV